MKAGRIDRVDVFGLEERWTRGRGLQKLSHRGGCHGRTRGGGPIGDTHRWGESEGKIFAALGRFYATADPQFASEMMGMRQLYIDQGMKTSISDDLLDADLSIPAMPLDRMDWSSKPYNGFGAVTRGGDARILKFLDNGLNEWDIGCPINRLGSHRLPLPLAA